MVSRTLVSLVLLLTAGCNPSRDLLDDALESALTSELAQLEALEAHRAERQAEHDELRKQLEAFDPVSTAELLALAGERARVVEDKAQGSFYRLVTISRTAPFTECVSYLLAALAKSRSVNVTTFTYSKEAWSASVAVIGVTKPKLSARGAPALAESSWCYASCRERRQRIADKNDRLSKLGTSLGALRSLPLERNLLRELLNIDSKFAGDAVVPMLEQLRTAAWLPAESTMGFSPKEVLLTAPASSATACTASLPKCSYDAAHQQLIVGL